MARSASGQSAARVCEQGPRGKGTSREHGCQRDRDPSVRSRAITLYPALGLMPVQATFRVNIVSVSITSSGNRTVKPPRPHFPHSEHRRHGVTQALSHPAAGCSVRCALPGPETSCTDADVLRMRAQAHEWTCSLCMACHGCCGDGYDDTLDALTDLCLPAGEQSALELRCQHNII